MPTPVKTPKPATCSRCGESLAYSSQRDHDLAHGGAERILSLVEGAPVDSWLIGEEPGDEYRLPEREILPVSSFGRRDGKTCGRQLWYAFGGYWPTMASVRIASAKEALEAGFVPRYAHFRPINTNDGRASPTWGGMVEALLSLPPLDRRKVLLGQPVPEGWYAENFSLRQYHPAQFWHRNGSMPVKGWTASPAMLHLPAYDALDKLDELDVLDAITPRKFDIFRAFDLVQPQDARVVILGQDPYPDPKHAMGLAFSSRAGQIPSSLRNIYKELADDLGAPPPKTGDLTHWTYQGVLLANTALTLGLDGTPHHDVWRKFTEAWVKHLAGNRPIVWILWGKQAQSWSPLIEHYGAGKPHAVIESAHPSPLSARHGFFGSKPFSRANAALQSFGLPEVRW